MPPSIWEGLDLKNTVDLILQNANETAPVTAEQTPNEVANQEMLALLRQQNALLSSPEKLLAPVLSALEQQSLRDRSGGSPLRNVLLAAAQSANEDHLKSLIEEIKKSEDATKEKKLD